MLTNSEALKKIEEASGTIVNMAKGTMITHLSMAELLGVQYKTPKYNSMVNRLSKALKKQGVFLDNEKRVGYKLVESGKEIDVQDRKCHKARRQFAKAVKEMQYINVDAIKDNMLRQKTIRIAQDRANILGMLKLGENKQIES